MPDAKNEPLTAEVKHSDISPDMRDAAIQLCVEAVSTLETESKMASFIKKKFDERFNGRWHCIVGRAYGSFITHSEKKFIYLQVGNQLVLLYKST